METPAQYGADRTAIRRECLRAFGDGWELPTAAEIRTVIKLAGLTGAEVARLVGLTDGRTVRRWTGGDSPIPFAAWAILCEKAGLGTIWRNVAVEVSETVSKAFLVLPGGHIGMQQADGSIKKCIKIEK